MEQWSIIVDNERLGPWDAHQVREALRQGRVKLHHQAIQEGAEKSQELINYTDIFPVIGSHSDQEDVEENPIDQALQVKSHDSAANTTPSHENDEPHSEEVLPKPLSSATEPQHTYKKKTQGGYTVLTENGDFQGRYYEGELLSLLQQGAFPAKFQIARPNSPNLMSVKQFLEAYGGIKSAIQKDQKRPRSLGLILVTILMTAAFGLITLAPINKNDWEKLENIFVQWLSQINKQGSHKKATTRQVEKTPFNAKVDEESIRPAKSSADQEKTEHLPLAVAPKERSQKKVEKVPGAIARLSETVNLNGKVIVLGPLTFDLADLQKCPDKCTLVMQDKQGAKVKVVFFKLAYYSQLENKSQGVFVRGRIEGITLYPMSIL